MTLINPQTRKKSGNGWLYTGNFVLGATIFFICTISAIPTSATLYVASFHIFGHETIYNIVSKLPEFMQFIEVGGVDYEINAGFYFAMACTVIAAVLVGCALYKMNANSKKIGENNCKSRILDSLEPKKDQKISYHNGERELDSNYVVLYKKYPYGCIIQSKSGKKIVKLHYEDEEAFSKGKTQNWSYKIGSYENTEKPKITKENFREDFFKKGKNTRDDVTISACELDPSTLSTLRDIVFDTHSKKEKVESSLPPK